MNQKNTKYDTIKILISAGLILFFLGIMSLSVMATTPDPGHSAAEIGPGTFAGAGNYLFPSTSNVSFDTSLLHIDSTKDRVGIGTATPGVKLEVYDSGTNFHLDGSAGASSTFTGMKFSTNGSDWEMGGRGSTDASVPNGFFIWENDDNAFRFVIKDGGNVGIGTASPDGKVEISQAYTSTIPNLFLDHPDVSWSTVDLFNSWRYIKTNSSATDGNFREFHVGAGGVSIGYPDTPVYGSSDAMYVQGQVGLSTTSPMYALDVAGSTVLGTGDGAYRTYIGRYNAGYPWALIHLGVSVSANNCSGLQFRGDDDSVIMTIEKAGGQVGIGITPAAKLHVYETTTEVPALDVTHTNGSTWSSSARFSNTAASGNVAGGMIRIGTSQTANANLVMMNFVDGARELVKVMGDGDVYIYKDLGIGTTNPGAKLDIYSTTSSDQLRISDSLTLPYKIGRNGTTGFLDFQGSQAGYTGYNFKSDDNSSLMTLNDAGDMDVGGTLTIGAATRYWSCSGIHFHARYPDTDDVFADPANGIVEATGNTILFSANVNLPHGAIVTAVEVFGNGAASAEAWELRRHLLGTISVTLMAAAAINTEDTSISSATIDNNVYRYHLKTSSIDAGDMIYGARITYTITQIT